MTRHWQYLCVLLLVGALANCAHGQAETARAEMVVIGALRPPGVVAAKVAGEPIDSGEVNRLIKQTLRGRAASKAAIPGLEAQALEQVINRRLVKLYLADQKKIVVTDAEIDKSLAEKQKALRKSESDLADLRGEANLTTAAFRDETEWEVKWTKYLQSLLTDQLMEKYFEHHRQEYDGTEMRFAHIVLRPNGTLDPEETDALVARADRIRDEIIGGLTTFEDAAKKYSSGPSREKGGDIGFIPRHGVMPEDFSKAAFGLKKGELSVATASHLGVHLILCIDIRPGTKTWRDVRREMQPAVMSELFSQVAALMRSKTEIEYTGATAHLDPETREVVQATGDADAPEADEKKADAKK
jgi:parvulin-like peptidyl-prolyl isomerase